MAGDKYFLTNTKSILHFEGTNNSTVFTDVKGKTWDNNTQTAKITNATSRYGNTCGQFDVNSYIYTNTATVDFNVGTGDFTFEISVKNTVSAKGILFYVRYPNGYSISIESDGHVALVNVGGSFEATSVAVNDDAWHDLAIQRQGTNIYIHVDGSNIYTGTSSAQMGGTTSYVHIGMNEFNADHYSGYMDEFRFTKGIALYGASSYTPAPFPDNPPDPGKAVKFVSCNLVKSTNLPFNHIGN